MKVLIQDDGTTFDELDYDTCARRLEWASIGRLATSVAGEAPEVVPVNYVVDNGCVVFCSSPERAARLAGRPASFEVDNFDWFHRLGWSVLVSGVIFVGPPEHSDGTTPYPWAPGDRRVLLRLEPDEVSGRQISQRPAIVSDLGYL